MKRDYISRLAFLARWRFSEEEAEDIISDYREMIANEPGTDRELIQRFGTPWAALRQIPSTGISRIWLAVFALSFACLLIPAAWVLWKNVNQLLFWLHFEKSVDVPSFLLVDDAESFLSAIWVLPLMLILGLVTPLAWFRSRGRDREPLTRGIVLTMLLLMVCLVWVWLFIWQMLSDFDGFTRLLNSLPWENSWGAWTVYRAVFFGVPAAVAGSAGIAGLLFARAKNRRWRAVYALALLVAVLTAALLLLLSSLNLDADGWQSAYLRYYTVLTLLGLLGTGVSLC